MVASPSSEATSLRLLELWFETTQWLLERTARFPKHLRHTLTERIELGALTTLELLTSASYRKGRSKEAQLREASDRMNALRILLRLAYSLRVLPNDVFEEAARRLVECGALLGGWIRQQQQPPGGSAEPG